MIAGSLPAPVILPKRFFTPSTMKLVTLSILSGGIYQAYWLFKYWQSMRDSGYKKVTPWLRLVFYPFYAYGCFKWIGDAARANGIPMRFGAGVLAIAFFVLTFISWLIKDYGIISLLNFLPIAVANRAAIAVNERFVAGFECDDALSAIDIWLTLGGAFLFLVMIVCNDLMSRVMALLPPHAYGL